MPGYVRWRTDAEWLQAHPFLRIRVSGSAAFDGYLSSLGASSLNLELSTGRYMHSHQTGFWPQGDDHSVHAGKSAKAAANSLVSEIRATSLGTSPETDLQIAQDVRDELEMEPSIRAAAIGIQVKDGIVTLSGVVDSDGERWLIESAARRIAGVKGLLAQLTVFAADVTPDDDDIARDCERVLEGLTPRDDYAIGVMVSHGWVTLSGDVAEGYERRIAETAVSSLLSVHGVNSQVRVRHLPAR